MHERILLFFCEDIVTIFVCQLSLFRSTTIESTISLAAQSCLFKPSRSFYIFQSLLFSLPKFLDPLVCQRTILQFLKPCLIQTISNTHLFAFFPRGGDTFATSVRWFHRFCAISARAILIFKQINS